MPAASHRTDSRLADVLALWHGTYNLTSATAGGHGLVAAVVSTGVMVGAVLIAWTCRRGGETTLLPHP